MPDLAKLKNAFPKESVARPISSPNLGLVAASSPSRYSVKFNLRMKRYYHRNKILSSARSAPLRSAHPNATQTIGLHPIWLGDLDSNQDKQVQNLLSYH